MNYDAESEQINLEIEPEPIIQSEKKAITASEYSCRIDSEQKPIMTPELSHIDSEIPMSRTKLDMRLNLVAAKKEELLKKVVPEMYEPKPKAPVDMAIVDVKKFNKRVEQLEALRRAAMDEIDELEADVGLPYEPDSNEIRNAGYVKIPD